MQRQWIGWLMLGLLAFPSMAEGQCRKRILVYLDVSLSMGEKGGRTESPYQETLSALGSLFQQTGFIEENDVVRVARFGSTLLEPTYAEGPAAVNQMIQRLKAERLSDRETHFGLAFDDLTKSLPEGVFNRQVVLFASDFAHEPQDGMKAGLAIPDWQEDLARAKTSLGGLFESRSAAVVLFQALITDGKPASRERKTIAAQVLADFRTGFPVVGVVQTGPGGGAAVENLTNTLRRSLIAPPELQVSRDSSDADSLAFTVTNKSCIPLHVARLSVKVEGGEAAHFQVDADEGELASTLVSARTRTFKKPVPEGTEWRERELEATVETREGVGGQSGGTGGSWLKHKPVSAVFERRLLMPDILRLDLDMTGFTDPATPTTYRLTFGDDASPVATATFEGPVLSSTEARHYRAVLPMNVAGAASPGVRVSIEVKNLPAEEGSVQLIEDKQSTYFHHVFAIVVLVVVISFASIFFWVRKVRSSCAIFQFSRGDKLQWMVAGSGVVILTACYLLRISILKRWSPGGSEELLGWVACILVFLLTVFLLLEVARTRFAQSVIEKEPLPLETYLRRGRLDTLLPWSIGLLSAIVVCAAFFGPLRPAGSSESRRGDNDAHERLHITSDKR
jgi:hypothetical protein